MWCVCAAWRTRHAAHTHTHAATILPQLLRRIFTDCIYKKSNFGQAQYRLPDDGLHGPKHVGVTVKTCFNVKFNILYVT